MSPKLFNLLLIIGSFVIYYFIISPLYSGEDTGIWAPENSISSLRQNVSKYNGALSKVDVILKEANTLHKDYEAIDDQVKKTMSVMVPTKVDEIRLLSEVSKIANESGIATKDITVKDKSGAFPRYTVAMTVKATYLQFKDFIARYETSMRLFSIETVSFKQAEDDMIKFDVMFSTHYLK